MCDVRCVWLCTKQHLAGDENKRYRPIIPELPLMVHLRGRGQVLLRMVSNVALLLGCVMNVVAQLRSPSCTACVT
jgi:hypothetical protein